MEFLKEFRLSLNLTLQGFADVIEVSKSYYEKIEKRRKKAKPRIYEKVKI